jgi:hypothetical protein
MSVKCAVTGLMRAVAMQNIVLKIAEKAIAESRKA